MQLIDLETNCRSTPSQSCESFILQKTFYIKNRFIWLLISTRTEYLEITGVGCNLKQFDGLTWLTLTPIFYDRSRPTTLETDIITSWSVTSSSGIRTLRSPAMLRCCFTGWQTFVPLTTGGRRPMHRRPPCRAGATFLRYRTSCGVLAWLLYLIPETRSLRSHWIDLL